jgi:hypothetical protein
MVLHLFGDIFEEGVLYTFDEGTIGFDCGIFGKVHTRYPLAGTAEYLIDIRI